LGGGGNVHSSITGKWGEALGEIVKRSKRYASLSLDRAPYNWTEWLKKEWERNLDYVAKMDKGVIKNRGRILHVVPKKGGRNLGRENPAGNNKVADNSKILPLPLINPVAIMERNRIE